MPDSNKAILQKANAAISRGDIEGFLSFCADDIEWTAVGDTTVKGKEAVRQMLAREYVEPPKYTVDTLIGEGEFLTALGDIYPKDANGKEALHSYCDVWRFRDGKMVQLLAFVIKPAGR
jgi:ketosteroid isomerase-like protein